MDKVLINIEEEGEWIRKHFKSSVVSVDDLLNKIENLADDVDYWKSMYEEQLNSNIMAREDAYDRWRDSQYDRE